MKTTQVSRREFVKSAGVAFALAATITPLGAAQRLLLGEDGARAMAAPLPEEWRPTTCWIGKQDCGVLARVVEGRVVKLEGHPEHPRNRGTLCPKGQAQLMALYDPYRVKTPLVRVNGKGESGKWREASWEEALTLVAEKINDARARSEGDRRLILWQKGRSHAGALYDTAFVRALGAEMLSHSAQCGDASVRATEYTVGTGGGLYPDFRHTNYLLAWGWNITEAGGPVMCWITWNQQFLAARERGMKVVHIDPRLHSAGPHADQWVPIRPGTDMALVLALAHVLVARGTIDWAYLKKHTNAPFLVGEDGLFLRVEGKEQVWDDASGSARPFDAAAVDPTLEGEFTLGGVRVKPAFQLFKDHLAQYTPEWAANVCGLSAEVIRRLAGELGDNARIGSTTVVDGITLPYRPVAIASYHMAQQELGFQTHRAMLMLMMLLGAVDAVGGQRTSMTRSVHGNFEAFDKVKVKEPPYNIYLKESKFFPINSKNSSMIAKVMLDPQKYGVDYTPEVLILHKVNPGVSFADQGAIYESYLKFKFIVAIDPWLSHTADRFADVVLPAAMLEKYEGPVSASNQYVDATALRLPVMKPLFQSRGEIDIYLDLCEKAGLLYGENGYLDQINRALGLDEQALPLDKKPAVREIYDRWAKEKMKLSEGIAFFEKNGVKVDGPVSAAKYYGYAAAPPFGGIRHRLYGEALRRLQGEMEAMDADRVYWQDYTPFPTFRPPTQDGSPPDYDLTLISYKKIEFKQGRASQIPILAEMAPQQRVLMNPQAAGARGISEGDTVWVESHHALTGQTRRVRVAVVLTEGIQPDTVAMPHHYGEVAHHPWAKEQGPTATTLFFTGEGYVANTQDQSFQVRVRVYKEE